jgi:hypothetical protein
MHTLHGYIVRLHASTVRVHGPPRLILRLHTFTVSDSPFDFAASDIEKAKFCTNNFVVGKLC